MSTIGILGGSFNPIHVGHVMLASYLSQYTQLDEVWLTLSPLNPLKNAQSLIADEHRLSMLEMSVASVSGIKVCDMELSLPRPSYTINTLENLKKSYPDKQFKLIIGTDNWLIFNQWKDYERIISEFGVIVYPRPGYHVNEINCSGIELVDAPIVSISSTFVRDGIASGKDMNAFLPQGVNDYILKHNLYQNI